MTREGGHSQDSVDRGLAEAFGNVRIDSDLSVLHALQARTGSHLGVHLDAPDGEDAPVQVTQEAKQLRDPSGRYQVLGEIGRGGMGVVYKGRDSDLGRDVALKVLKDEYADRPEVLARFVEEAQIGGQLQHPGIVPVYELGLQAGERPYFAMKLVKGETLAAQLSRRDDPADDRRRFLGIFEQACQTMAYAHARRVMHRDLKPANVMIGAFGEVQVVDWGFAKVLPRDGVAEDQESVTSKRSVIETVRSQGSGSDSVAGSMLGTPAYMPPEQAQGDVERLDVRSDVFGLGAILCEILTGEPPYRSKASDLVRQAANAELDDAYERLSRCSADPVLIALCTECLARARRARPESAVELAQRVSAYLTSVEERARRAEIHAAEARFKHRATLLGAAAGFVILSLAAGTWFWLDQKALARRGIAMQRVAAARSEASGAHGQALAASSSEQSRSLWTTAVSRADQLLSLAGAADVDSSARSDAAQLHATVHRERGEVEADLQRRERDAVMVQRLSDLRVPIEDNVRVKGWMEKEALRLNEQYESAFIEYLGGASPLDPSSEESSAAALRGEIHVELATSLDHWGLVRDILHEAQHDIDAGATARIHQLASQIDPDNSWRTQLRVLLQGSSREGDRLRDLAEEVETTSLSAAGCRVLAAALERAGEIEASTTVLRRGQELYPRDFDLCFRLAVNLERLEVPAWEEVVATYKIANALEPDHLEVLHRLGLAYENLGKYQDSRRIVRQLLTRHSTNVHLLRHLAGTFSGEGRLEEALEVYERALRIDPRGSESHLGIGVTLAGLGRHEEAIDHYRKAVEFQPLNVRAISTLGNAFRRQGQLDEALAHQQRALKIDPESAMVHSNLGFVLLKLNRVDEAIDHINRALELVPNFALARTNLGSAFSQQGDVEKAEQCHRRAIESDPLCSAAHNNLGNLLSRQGRTEEAIDCLERASEIDPRNAKIQNNLGLALARNGELEKAIECYRSAIEADPDDLFARYNLGLALIDDGNLDEAVESLYTAVDIDPDYAAAWNQLGAALRLQGEQDEAIECFRTAHDLDPQQFTYLYHLGTLLSELRRLDEAIECLEQAAELRPRSPQVRINLGIAYKLNDQLEEAIECYRDALAIDPSIPQGHINLGNALFEQGDGEAALEAYETFLKVIAGQDTPVVQEYRDHASAQIQRILEDRQPSPAIEGAGGDR